MTTPNDKGAAAPPAFSFPTADHPEEGEKVRTSAKAQPDEDQLDQAIAQSFPASDPVSVTVSPLPKDDAQKDEAKKKAAGSADAPHPTAGFWAVALLSTAVLGVGAALLVKRQRSTAQRVAARVPSDLWKPLQRAARSAHLPRGHWL